MRRTLQINLHTTIIILFVVSWLSCPSVQGFPAANRAASGESMLARRRGGDDLIAGSDFLNMFIGSKVDPSVRSRRYPLVRADIADPRQGHSSDSDQRTPSRQLRPPSEGRDIQDHSRRRTNNVDPNEKLSGLIKSQDRQNYHFETQDPHNSNKVDHAEYLQRRGGIRFKYVQPIDRKQEDSLSAVTEDAVVRGVMASEARVFGGRTLPRTSSNAPSAVTNRLPTSAEVEVTDSYITGTSDDYHRASMEIDEHTHTNEASEASDKRNDHIAATRKTKVSFPPKFSVSSSVKKVISIEDEHHDIENLQINESTQSNNEATSTSPNHQVVTETVTEQEGQTKQTQDDVTSSMSYFHTSTESNAYTTEDESTTFIAVTDSDVSTERNEDWSTKSDDFTSEPTVTANVEEIPDGAQFQKVGIPQERHETAVKVVSVSVSSSVGQVAPSVSLLREATAKKNTILNLNTISEEPSLLVDSPIESQDSNKPNSEAFTLETEDHPQVTSVQRSELLVEESSPSEVTANPFTSYTSYLSSNYQSVSTNYYQVPLEHTSSNPQVASGSFQSSLMPTKTERRLQYFNHSPRNHRNPTIEALQRSSEDSLQLNGFVRANIQDVSPRRYAPHAQPRTQESILQSLRQEPVSVAESIQRSIITRQDADRSETRSVSSRSQFHQNKNGFADGGFQGEEARDRKRYSQPERVWGEPEKVYGEPEKVYGEPEKVYGEPEKVYGEQAKVYGEPEKNYEVDEAVSVLTNGRAHGVQPTQGSPLPATKVDSGLKMIDSKQQDPNHKFGYVVEGRNFRKYRVEERTSDGFIVGEYGVVSHDDGSLRGVRYTADESINPRLIYDTLVKFLSL